MHFLSNTNDDWNAEHEEEIEANGGTKQIK
jgi:hypothetical protein